MDVIDAMEKQWEKEPPVGLLVAHFLGFKRKAPVKASKGGVQKLLEMFPTGTIGGPPKGE